LRILHINNIADVANTIAAAQRELLGHETRVINIIPQQNPIQRFGKLITLLERIRLVLKARREIISFKPDVVHLHFATSAIWMLGVNAKFVVHAHGSDVRLKKGDYLRKIINYLGLRCADILIYATPDLEAHAKLYGKPCFYVPNPIDSMSFRCDSNEFRKVGARKVFLFAIPSAIKGFEVASAALSLLLMKLPDLRITIFMNDVSKAFFDKNSYPSVCLINTVKQDSISRLICDHDVIVGQFKLGSFGVSELQAMSCGKPVICNGKYSFPSSDSPPHFQAENSDQIISHLEYLLAAPDDILKVIASRSVDFIHMNYSLSNIMNTIEGLYRVE
jgi:glycosyltransferase involved in cell wall biosynthesis